MNVSMVCMNGSMYVCTYVYMYAYVYVCNACIYVSMNVCMYICISFLYRGLLRHSIYYVRLTVHGASLSTLLHKSRGYSQMLLVIKDNGGKNSGHLPIILYTISNIF